MKNAAPGLITYQMCDPRQITWPLCASISRENGVVVIPTSWSIYKESMCYGKYILLEPNPKVHSFIPEQIFSFTSNCINIPIWLMGHLFTFSWPIWISQIPWAQKKSHYAVVHLHNLTCLPNGALSSL